MIPPRLVKRGSIRHTTRTLIAANETGVPILGWTTLKAYVSDTEVLIHGLVSEHIVDVMLGIDWLQDNEVVWNFTGGKVRINRSYHELAAKETRGSWCRRVIPAHDVTTAPSSQLDTLKLWLMDNDSEVSEVEGPAGDGLGSRQHQGHPRRRYPRQQSRGRAVSYRV